MAIHINRVYTRSGDHGETGLVGGKRVRKDSARIEAYGDIDELNAALGLARVFNGERSKEGDDHRWLDEVFRRLQNELFDLGAELATPPDGEYPGMNKISAEQVNGLEQLIDRCQEELEPLQSFILPGGGRVSGFLHQARTICRRAERKIVALASHEPVSDGVLQYVNRLSDLLFVLGRWVAKHGGEGEYLWERGLRSHGMGSRSTAARKSSNGRR